MMDINSIMVITQCHVMWPICDLYQEYICVHILVWHCKVESARLEILVLLVHAYRGDYKGGLKMDREWQNTIQN